MKRLALALAALALALGAPLPAAAEPRHPAYLVVKAGGYFPMAHDVSGYDADLAGEVALGYAPDPGFAFELAGGAFRTRSSAGGGDLRELQVVPITFAIRGTVPLKGFEPYAILGGGAYLVHDEVGGAKDDAASFGLFLGAGGNANLTSHLFIGLEARYLFLGTHTFNTSTRLDGITLTGDVGFRF
jgi:opacity protein-like surface antigen